MGVGGAVNTSVQVGVAQVASEVATGMGGAGKVAGGGRTSSVLSDSFSLAVGDGNSRGEGASTEARERQDRS